MSLTSGNRETKPTPRRSLLKTREPAKWEEVSSDAIRDCIVQVGSIGGAVRFGHSRDGGCLSVGVYGVYPEPFTDYLRPGDDVEAYLDQLADFARDIAKTSMRPNDNLVPPQKL